MGLDRCGIGRSSFERGRKRQREGERERGRTGESERVRE